MQEILVINTVFKITEGKLIFFREMPFIFQKQKLEQKYSRYWQMTLW